MGTLKAIKVPLYKSLLNRTMTIVTTATCNSVMFLIAAAIVSLSMLPATVESFTTPAQTKPIIKPPSLTTANRAITPTSRTMVLPPYAALATDFELFSEIYERESLVKLVINNDNEEEDDYHYTFEPPKAVVDVTATEHNGRA